MTIKITDEMVRVAIEAYGAETGGILWQSGMTAALEAAFAMLPEPACGCREALEKLADLDVPRPIGKSWRADGSESKHDECVHGVYMYADCPECIAEFVRAALAKPQGCGVPEPQRKFKIGDEVYKTKGSNWHGYVVGFYSTALTPIGYAVESCRELGSVQIYPEAALAAAPAHKGEG